MAYYGACGVCECAYSRMYICTFTSYICMRISENEGGVLFNHHWDMFQRWDLPPNSGATVGPGSVASKYQRSSWFLTSSQSTGSCLCDQIYVFSGKQSLVLMLQLKVLYSLRHHHIYDLFFYLE